MKIAIRFWWKSRLQTATILSFLQILFYNLLYEIQISLSLTFVSLALYHM